MSTNKFDFLAHLERQRKFSVHTFGPGARSQGIVDHIRKELIEVLAAPSDLFEWIDVVILALDGAWRSGAEPQQIIDALVEKQTKNESRQWPDWKFSDPSKAIEHVRNQGAVKVENSNGPAYTVTFVVKDRPSTTNTRDVDIEINFDPPLPTGDFINTAALDMAEHIVISISNHMKSGSYEVKGRDIYGA